MILVIGETGQLARELAPYGVRTAGRAEADLTDPRACAALIRDARPSAVINAVAYTAVDRAEEDEATARIVNADAPAAMAAACADLRIPLIHVSTDYVFDGTGDTPRTPDAPTDPLGAYGRTKLAGEEAVRASGAVHAILRTSWVVSAHGANFVKTMLRLGAERDSLTIVADQIGGPTPARDLAAACMAATKATEATSGTYHYAGAPDVSWADFARAIFAKAGIDCAVEDIPTSAYPTPATRPLNSRLDCTSFERAFGHPRPDWRQGLDAILSDLGAT